MKYSTKEIKPLTSDNILKLITAEEIFRKYIPFEFEIGSIYKAPDQLRISKSDTKASFGIYYNNYYSKLMFKDYNGYSGDCFRCVSLLYNISFFKALVLINRDFNLNLGYGSNKSEINSVPLKKEEYVREIVKLGIECNSYNEVDKNFWSSYGITYNTLKFYNIFKVKYLCRNGYLHWTSTYNDPIYSYFFPRTGNMKIYRPLTFNKMNKWRGNANNDLDIQGYDQLPQKGEVLIITKAMKDIMTLYELGYNAVAPHAEGTYINPDFIRHIKGRFKHIYCIYDFDKAGIRGAKHLWKEFGIQWIFIPKQYRLQGIKDISDFYKEKGKEIVKEFLKSKII